MKKHPKTKRSKQAYYAFLCDLRKFFFSLSEEIIYSPHNIWLYIRSYYLQVVQLFFISSAEKTSCF